MFTLIPTFSVESKNEKIRVVIIPVEKKFSINSIEMQDIAFVKKFKRGFIAYVPRGGIEKLKKRGYKVYEDYKVSTFLSESVPLIKANNVWKILMNNTNITGKDVSVCVIDTGVDYLHPDLGGCFPNKKGNGTEMSYILESEHPYSNNLISWYNISYPGFERISIHFSNYSVEGGYDFIEIYDENYTLIVTYTGYDYDVWTPVINGSIVRIKLISDETVTDYGFYIDKISNITTHELDWSECEKIIGGYDFVNSNFDPSDHNGHGTHVAGIIAANGTLKGVAPDAKIVAVKVLDANGEGYLTDIVSGIEWCVNHSEEYNIVAISMSLGTTGYHNNTYCDDDFKDPYFLTEAIDSAVANGISVVVATGNEYVTSGVSSPACIYNSTRVSATDKSDNIASFANRGGDFDIILMAPGVNINSTWTGGYAVESGTSMATPHVSGVVALLKQANASLEPKKIEELLNDTGKVIYDSDSGKYYSRIDVYEAIKYAVHPKLLNISLSSFYGNSSTIFNFTVEWLSYTNTFPKEVSLYISTLGNFSMKRENLVDNDATDGVRYFANVSLPNGIYNFSISAIENITNFRVVTNIIGGPWVADTFWIDNITEINQITNLSEKCIISNTSLVNITNTLILSDSYVNALNDIEFVVYGNLTLNSSTITNSVTISSYGNLFVNDFESPSEIAGYSGSVEIYNSSLNLIRLETNSTLKNVNVSQLRVILESDSVLENFHKEGVITSTDANLSLENITTSVFWLDVINSNLTISNSTLDVLYLNDSFAEVHSSYFDSIGIIGNSSIKGYLSLGNITISPNSTLNRYFPVKLVKDISGTPVDRNVSTWKDSYRYNFSTVNGFVWINETFETIEEEYLLWIENYGFAQINGSNITLFAGKNISQNITIDVVYPFVKNLTFSHIFISPNVSLGKKDNTTISFNESEPLKSKCILVKKDNSIVEKNCGINTYIWSGKDQEGNIVSDGNYSVWLNLSIQSR